MEGRVRLQQQQRYELPGYLFSALVCQPLANTRVCGLLKKYQEIFGTAVA